MSYQVKFIPRVKFIAALTTLERVVSSECFFSQGFKPLTEKITNCISFIGGLKPIKLLTTHYLLLTTSSASSITNCSLFIERILGGAVEGCVPLRGSLRDRTRELLVRGGDRGGGCAGVVGGKRSEL